MGKSCGLVWRSLSDAPMRAVDLAAATGKHRHTVGRALRKLEKHGLASETAGGWKRGAATLRDVADKLGCESRARLRRAAHERERERWAKHVNDSALEV